MSFYIVATIEENKNLLLKRQTEKKFDLKK